MSHQEMMETNGGCPCCFVYNFGVGVGTTLGRAARRIIDAARTVAAHVTDSISNNSIFS
ncbi:MAG: hypothetical protein FWC94_07865 [Bacteroidales bacterium]|nr:hypothetical protein [Bacteroidales bacterium]